jgi:hypothetical protein
MDRRRFLHYSSLAAAGGATTGWNWAQGTLSTTASGSGRPQLGTQLGGTQPSDDTLRALAEFGVSHICSGLPSRRLDDNWSVEALTKLRERIESYGIKLQMMPLPMSSVPIDKAEFPNIMLVLLCYKV